MKVLALDTAGPVIGVALRVDGVTEVRTSRVQRGSEGLLVPWVQELCAEAGTTLSELDAVATAVGPGAFTGLRVGLATATGLAFGAGIPVVSVSSLASRAADHPGRVLCMLDARKSRVYAQWFQDGVASSDPVDWPPDQVLEGVAPGFVATGEGASVYRELVVAAGGALAETWESPAVDVLARMGEEAFARGEGTDPVLVRPVYLRAPDARPPKFI
ncbi:MAG: tRNA (adenosine(37)-N6)-threonylcarbamoyltransferase complex dimerization subunit type 1 TsaB [Proteobacteria bacterium]|nr:tRNA (adenosine(37)-N6)-threonylcarbamoyltransferase complex dimerization subunit type 1 TsaB [Pseudomonadota bacterium]